MEVIVEISDKYLKAAAAILIASSYEDIDDELDKAVEKCKDASIHLDFKDFEESDAKKVSAALALYAILKNAKLA